jgi:hypothetical protein
MARASELPAEATTVIDSMADQKVGKIIKALADAGIKSPRGADRWNPATIARYLDQRILRPVETFSEPIFTQVVDTEPLENNPQGFSIPPDYTVEPPKNESTIVVEHREANKAARESIWISRPLGR